MYPLSDHEALSGVFGSVSLAAWIFLLLPQLVENYKRSSADGISLTFLTVWFIGDLANFFGAIWAGLVPTVIALAVYFCFADAVLITQCLYYDFVNSSRRTYANDPAVSAENDVERPLLDPHVNDQADTLASRRRRRSSHASHLRRDSLSQVLHEKETPTKIWTKNAMSMVLICVAGTAGWAVAWATGVWVPTPEAGGDGNDPVKVALGAQILGYLSAICYLGARIPQIIKNHRERSCEGLSLLFFLLSLLGNATYGAGILFHSLQTKYVMTSLPWLIGSWGTMLEDAVIFCQFHKYKSGEEKPVLEAIAG